MAAAVVAVRVDAVVRIDVAVLLAAVAVPFLAAMEPVRFEVAVLVFGTRGRFSAVVCEEGETQEHGRCQVRQT